jgi:deoxyadenosine/deoxycytidine kinase
VKHNPLVIIEGNIASGKSTAAAELGKRLNMRVLQEPVDEELLKLFYEDKDRWAFPFQIEMLHRRWALQMSAASETLLDAGYEGAILDRSLQGDLVFCRALYEAGVIHAKEFEIYLNALRSMKLVLYPPTVFVYLSAQPETCFERLKKRNRLQEEGVELSYLKTIHEGYQRLLHEVKTGAYPWSHAVTVLVAPWDPDTVTDEAWNRTAAMVSEVC